MNGVHHALTRAFDILLAPLEMVGRPFALVVISAVFGILALILFKRISWQKGIKAAKDKIKAHLIEIRIYQDDLAIVGQAIGKVLLRNLQYMALNFGPFVPLSVPLVLVLAQLVARYAYAPIPVHAQGGPLLPGRGTTIQVELSRERAADVAGLRIELPPGLEARSPLVRVPSEGRAFQEILATAPGAHEIGFALADGTRERKALVAGEGAAGAMQPERGKGFLSALLWPVEDSFDSRSPFEKIRFDYPDSRLGWLPGGASGVLIVFLVASMAAGLLVLKPLKIQI